MVHYSLSSSKRVGKKTPAKNGATGLAKKKKKNMLLYEGLQEHGRGRGTTNSAAMPERQTGAACSIKAGHFRWPSFCWLELCPEDCIAAIIRHRPTPARQTARAEHP